MKKLTLLFIFLYACLSVSAQPYLSEAELSPETVADVHLGKLMELSALIYDKGDYGGAMEAGSPFIEWYESLDTHLKSEVFLPHYLYLFMSEAAVRSGDLARGLEYLEKSIANGCDKYSSILDLFMIEDFRKYPGFEELVGPLRDANDDYIGMLRHDHDYRIEETERPGSFRYSAAGYYPLEQTREYFHLDTLISGKDELSGIIAVMDWVHDNIPHNGSAFYPGEPTATGIYHFSKATGTGVNCRMLATALNECYLSLGLFSRVVTCMPADEDDSDCHVINAVWSNQLGKWLWMDPTYAAYVTDREGNLLEIGEVRQRLIDGEPVEVRETANWNRRDSITSEFYLYNYMAKNLYVIECWMDNSYNTESYIRDGYPEYIQLRPHGTETQYRRGSYQTSDPQYFWQAPR